MKVLFVVLLIGLGIFYSPIALAVQDNGEALSALEQQAKDAYAGSDWPLAIDLYSQIIAQEPNNFDARLRLGIAQHRAGQHLEALATLDAVLAEAPNFFKSQASIFAAASAYASGNKDRAFEYLLDLVERGVLEVTLNTNAALADMRDDARFAEVLAAWDQKYHVCKHEAPYQEFDFWIGEWTAYADEAKTYKAGRNVVKREVDGCLIRSWWTSSGEIDGQGVTIYDRAKKVWRHIWVDELGDVWRYEGGVKDGVMRLEGEQSLRGGDSRLSRMSFELRDDGGLNRLTEFSTDDGETWMPYFNFVLYRDETNAEAASKP